MCTPRGPRLRRSAPYARLLCRCSPQSCQQAVHMSVGRVPHARVICPQDLWTAGFPAPRGARSVWARVVTTRTPDTPGTPASGMRSRLPRPPLPHVRAAATRPRADGPRFGGGSPYSRTRPSGGRPRWEHDELEHRLLHRGAAVGGARVRGRGPVRTIRRLRRPHAAAGQRRRAVRAGLDAAVQGRDRRRGRVGPRHRLLPAGARDDLRRDGRPLRSRRAGRPGHHRGRAAASRRAGPGRRRAVPPHAVGQRADRGQRRLLRRDRPREGDPAPAGRRRHPDRADGVRRRGPGRRRRRPGPGRRSTRSPTSGPRRTTRR